MEEESPYTASKVAPDLRQNSWVIEIPSDITRPIKHLWILLCIQTVLALGWGVVQMVRFPSGGMMFMLLFGITAAINAAFALGVYNRFQLAATALAGLSGLSLVYGLFNAVQGNVSVISLGASAVSLFFSIRGAMAIHQYHAFVANARRRPPGPRLSDDPAFAEKQEAESDALRG